MNILLMNCSTMSPEDMWNSNSIFGEGAPPDSAMPRGTAGSSMAAAENKIKYLFYEIKSEARTSRYNGSNVSCRVDRAALSG